MADCSWHEVGVHSCLHVQDLDLTWPKLQAQVSQNIRTMHWAYNCAQFETQIIWAMHVLCFISCSQFLALLGLRFLLEQGAKGSGASFDKGENSEIRDHASGLLSPDFLHQQQISSDLGVTMRNHKIWGQVPKTERRGVSTSRICCVQISQNLRCKWPGNEGLRPWRSQIRIQVSGFRIYGSGLLALSASAPNLRTLMPVEHVFVSSRSRPRQNPIPVTNGDGLPLEQTSSRQEQDLIQTGLQRTSQCIRFGFQARRQCLHKKCNNKSFQLTSCVDFIKQKKQSRLAKFGTHHGFSYMTSILQTRQANLSVFFLLSLLFVQQKENTWMLL